MSLSPLYLEMNRQALVDATAQIVTHDNSLLEIQVCSGIIIHGTSRRLSLEQIADVLLKDDIQKVGVKPATVSPDIVQAALVQRTIARSVPFVFGSGRVPPARLVAILSLLAAWAKSATVDGRASLDAVAEEIRKTYPEFTVDAVVIGERLERLAKRLRLATLLPTNGGSPPDAGTMFAWVAKVGERITSQKLRELILCNAFFGEAGAELVGARVAKDAGLGAKPGYCTLSKNVYVNIADCPTVTLFQGAREAGSLRVTSSFSATPDISVTKTDLTALKIADGDTVIVVFEKREG